MHFKINHDMYKEINDELVQRLFEFTDFQAFKASMIERKKASVKDKAATNTDDTTTS